MYTFESRIRYSECDSTGKLSLYAMVNYFQDCSTFQSEDLGVGLQYLEERHQAWLLASWQIIVNRFPKIGERVIVGTIPYILKDFLGHRNFFMKTADGEILAQANSLWTLIDMQTMKPAHPTPDMVEGYVLEPRLDMEYAGRKIVIDEGGREEQPIRVEQYHLDTNHHVNNAQFVNMAMAYLPEGFQLRQLRVEYKKQARLGDELIPYVVETPEKCEIVLRDAAGNVFINTEWQAK